MEETFVNDVKIEETIKNFEKMHEGLVLEPLMLESDTEIEDPVKEILPEIQKTYPEAILFSCDKIPEIVTTEDV